VQTEDHRQPQSEVDKTLVAYQLPRLVVRFAKENPGLKECSEFLNVLAADQARYITTQDQKALKRHYWFLVANSLRETRMVATTLSKAANGFLMAGIPFEPEPLVCDESGQCLGGDHMIGMLYPSVRAVILFGDP
jgi:hypothetical protein